MTPKNKVKKSYPTAISRPPRPDGIYDNQWTIVVPPTSRGVFGYMARIIGHGNTARMAWAGSLERLERERKQEGGT